MIDVVVVFDLYSEFKLSFLGDCFLLSFVEGVLIVGMNSGKLVVVC